MSKLCFFTLLLFPFCLFSQEKNNERTVQPGLLRAQGTFSMGTLTEINQTSLHLHGNIEYYVNEKIAARGDIYYYLKPSKESVLDLNHQLFAGTSYHIGTANNLDPYIGIQPGLAITQYSERILLSKNTASLTPLLSGVVGLNYYANNWFHLFIDGRYILGKHISNLPPTAINEFRISFGLGFNIGT